MIKALLNLCQIVNVVLFQWNESDINFSRNNLEKQQLEKRHCQAGCIKESTKKQLNTATPHLSLQQSVKVDSSRETQVSAPKKSSLKKQAKTYDVVTTTSVEKEGVDKKSRLDPVNLVRDNMQKKVVAELATSLVNRKPQQTGFTVPTVGTADAGGGVGGGKDSMLRSGSVGNVAGLNSAMGRIQTSNNVRSKFKRIPKVNSDSTEFTGATPKGSRSQVIPAEASEFDFDWRRVFRRLLSDHKVSDIDRERIIEAEKKEKMLLEWITAKSHDATYPALVKVLRELKNNNTADQIEEWLEKKKATGTC